VTQALVNRLEVIIVVAAGIFFVVFLLLVGCASQELSDAGAQVSYEGEQVIKWSNDSFTRLQSVLDDISKTEVFVASLSAEDTPGIASVQEQLDSLSKRLTEIDFGTPAWRGERIKKLGELIAQYGGTTPMEVDDETFPIVIYNLTDAISRIEKLRTVLFFLKIPAALGSGFGSWIAVLLPIITAAGSYFVKHLQDKKYKTFSTTMVDVTEKVETGGKPMIVEGQTITPEEAKKFKLLFKNQMTNVGIQSQFAAFVKARTK
jgi:hypothetical protein